MQLKWREAQEEVLGLRAKLNDMQAAAVQSDSLGRLLADSERAKAALEMDVSQLLRENRHFRMHAELGTGPGFYYLWDKALPEAAQ